MRDTGTPVLHMLQEQRSTDSTVNPLAFVPAGTAGGQSVLQDGSRAKLCPFVREVQGLPVRGLQYNRETDHRAYS